MLPFLLRATIRMAQSAQAAGKFSSSSSLAAAAASNRLHLSRSPYLAQHAEDPVHWQCWGDEAFELARKQNRLVFLSIGYSTCHWCHVMHRESFQNADVARVLNEKFVSIKVDREERPDVDRVYMNFVLALGVGGGWPLSVWLTPDKKPVFGGTYYPPDDRYFGRPGFVSVLNSLSNAWENKREQVESQGAQILDALRQHAVPPAGTSSTAGAAAAAAFDPARPVALCLRQLRERFDAELGGFGKAPKFPQPTLLHFLLRLAALKCAGGGDSASAPSSSSASSSAPSDDAATEALAMCRKTLDCMARGGMHDHVNGGFHRYSTDANWHVPHFEKMLYDQAQLCTVYALAARLCSDDKAEQAELAATVADIVDYVNAELSHPSGAFFSAQDADSYPEAGAQGHKKEGAFCVWSWPQLAEALEGGSIGGVSYLKAFAAVYSCSETGNVSPYQDPHDELKGQNVLIRRKAWPELAQQLALPEPDLRAAIDDCLRRLRPFRAARPAPHLDNKILTSWNAMMISALATAGRLLDRPEYLERARRGVDFLRRYLWDAESRTLHRVGYANEDGTVDLGAQPVKAFLDDHAQLIAALLQLYRAGLNSADLAWALELQSVQDAEFWCADTGAYFDSRQSKAPPGADDAAPELPLRLLEDHDGAEPCGNSVTAVNLAALRAFRGGSSSVDFDAHGRRLLGRFGQVLGRQPLALAEMASACQLFAAGPPATLVLAAPPGADGGDLEPMLRAAWASPAACRPDLVIMRPADAEWCRDYAPLGDRATAYLCRDFACQLPVTEPEKLAELLAAF